MNLPKNINLSEESPNFPSLTFFVLSNVNSRLAFLVFLFGGDFLEFSRPLACIWKLFRPCSNPSNLKQTKWKLHDFTQELELTFLDQDFCCWTLQEIFSLWSFEDSEYQRMNLTVLHPHIFLQVSPNHNHLRFYAH